MTPRQIMRKVAEEVGADETLIAKGFSFADSQRKKSERACIDKELTPEMESMYFNLFRGIMRFHLLRRVINGPQPIIPTHGNN